MKFLINSKKKNNLVSASQSGTEKNYTSLDFQRDAVVLIREFKEITVSKISLLEKRWNLL